MPVLRLGSLEPVPYALRDLTGASEYAVDTSDPERAAYELASTLVRLPDGITLEALPVALLHRLYHAIYRALYRGPVQNIGSCSACADSFEFDLDLEGIIRTQDAQAADTTAPNDGWWTLPGGSRLRAPCHADLREGSVTGLLARISHGQVPDGEASSFLEKAAPLLDFDVETTCPHCDTAQTLRFSMPRYLVRKVAGERPFLLREVHLLASQYRWSHAEIMALPRRDRRDLAGLIQSERHQRRGIRAVS